MSGITEIFVPYFVVYRYKDSTADSPLCMHCFMTLHLVYDFIHDNEHRLSMYRVGRTLEVFNV